MLRALERVEGGTIELSLPSGNVRRFGSGRPVDRRGREPRRLPAPALAAADGAGRVVRRRRLATRTTCRWSLRAAGRHGRVLAARLACSPGSSASGPHVSPRQSLRRATANIGYHYDLGNDLYRLFLDESMTYSCGIWEEGDTLAQAPGAEAAAGVREARARARRPRARDRLRLGVVRPDGGGGVRCAGDRADAVRAAGRGSRASGRTGCRSRSASRTTGRSRGSFTKIASIEMLEAIGHAQYPVFFGACDRLLAAGGRACVQTIAIPDERYERYRRHDDWIRRYIFPGSLLPSVEVLERAMAGTALRLGAGRGHRPELRARRCRPGASGSLARLDDGAPARLRRSLRPDVGVLPRLLRGGVPHRVRSVTSSSTLARHA